jgi:hypothetical protein
MGDHRPHRGTGEREWLGRAAQVGGENVDQLLAVDEPAEQSGGGQQPEQRSQYRR